MQYRNAYKRLNGRMGGGSFVTDVKLTALYEMVYGYSIAGLY